MAVSDGKMAVLISVTVVLMVFLLPNLIFWNRKDHKRLFKFRDRGREAKTQKSKQTGQRPSDLERYASIAL